MARYDIAPAWFITPRGHGVFVYLREGTNDWNTAYSCLNEDEYGAAGLDVQGTFLDIGGHLGTFSLGVLIDNPQARAVIVEPVPENLDMIARNLETNRLTDRATVIAGAVGHGPMTIAYAYRGSENALHHAFVGNADVAGGPGGPHKQIDRVGLSFAELGEAFSLVKTDCEGGEWAVLGEMADVPLIVGELHPTGLPDGSAGSLARAEALLGATHDLTFSGQGPWGFRAVRR